MFKYKTSPIYSKLCKELKNIFDLFTDGPGFFIVSGFGSDGDDGRIFELGLA
jgi:hypothetical protein